MWWFGGSVAVTLGVMRYSVLVWNDVEKMVWWCEVSCGLTWCGGGGLVVCL